MEAAVSGVILARRARFRVERQAVRKTITGIARQAQKTKILPHARHEDGLACLIIDVSRNGYRVALKGNRSAEGLVHVGQEVVFELTDRTWLTVAVRWVRGCEIGFEIVGEAPGRFRGEAVLVEDAGITIDHALIEGPEDRR
jgi:hypothetical protein